MAISEHAMFILDRAGPRPAVGSKTKMKNTFVHGFLVAFGLSAVNQMLASVAIAMVQLSRSSKIDKSWERVICGCK